MGPGQLGPPFVTPHTISRSGVIPHGTTIHLTGNVTASDIQNQAPTIAELWEQQYLAVSPTMGINPQKDLIPRITRQPGLDESSREEQNPEGGADFAASTAGEPTSRRCLTTTNSVPSSLTLFSRT